MQTESVERYRSAAHPGDVPASVAFGTYLMKPIAATMTPVMIVSVILVLQAYDLFGFLAWAAPAAIAVAVAWTWYRFRTIVVEVVVSQNGAAALSVMEATRSEPAPRLQRVFDVHRQESGARVTIGRAAYELQDQDWPQMKQMLQALRVAKMFYE